MALKFQSLAERQETLEGLDLIDNIGAPTYPVYWKKQHIDLRVQRVPIEFPFFNLSNARTKDTQAEYISIHNKSVNFFKTLDDLEAQESQYEILKNNYVKTTGDSISSILYKNLKNGEQTEPLVLTKDYKVLSGNRRLLYSIIFLGSNHPKLPVYLKFEILSATCSGVAKKIERSKEYLKA